MAALCPSAHHFMLCNHQQVSRSLTLADHCGACWQQADCTQIGTFTSEAHTVMLQTSTLWQARFGTLWQARFGKHASARFGKHALHELNLKHTLVALNQRQPRPEVQLENQGCLSGISCKQNWSLSEPMCLMRICLTTHHLAWLEQMQLGILWAWSLG